MKISNSVRNFELDKKHARLLSEEEIKEQFRSFLNGNQNLNDAIQKELKKIVNVVNCPQNPFRLYSTSLLITYDAQDLTKSERYFIESLISVAISSQMTKYISIVCHLIKY